MEKSCRCHFQKEGVLKDRVLDRKCTELRILTSRCELITGEYERAAELIQKAKSASEANGWTELSLRAKIESVRLIEEQHENNHALLEIQQIYDEFPEAKVKPPEQAADIFCLASQAEENLGNYEKAEQLIREGLDLLGQDDRELSADEAESRVSLINALGKIYAYKSHFRKASDTYRKALAECRDEYKFQQAYLYGNLGMSILERSNHAEAEACFLCQREIYDEVPACGVTADELYNFYYLIEYYSRKHNLEQAEVYVRKAEKRMENGGQRFITPQLLLHNTYGCALIHHKNVKRQ